MQLGRRVVCLARLIASGIRFLPGVPHKAVAEVSKAANYRRLVAVNHGSQNEPTDGPTSGLRQRSVVEVADVIVAEM